MHSHYGGAGIGCHRLICGIVINDAWVHSKYARYYFGVLMLITCCLHSYECV